MLSLPRFLALSLALLLMLVAAAFGAQVWLRKQETRLQVTSQREVRARLTEAVAVTGQIEPGWTETRLALIERLAGVSVSRESEPPGLEVEPGVWLKSQPALAPAQRLLLLHQRVLLGLGVLGALLFVLLAGAAVLRRSREDGPPTPNPASSQQRDTLSLAQLAQTSVQQQVELDRERDERLRAEAEARIRLQLLNRALEEKIRIGRDLHDGVIQSLYAAGLTLQSAQPLIEANPDEAARRTDTTVEMINRTIAEIRAYITGLSPLSVRGTSMAQALADIVEELRAGGPGRCDVQVDESAAAALGDLQMAEALQIAREAVSNALRHGRANEVRVRLHAADDGVHLHVQDDGCGFDPDSARAGGHGLVNMRARATQSGARLVLDSAPGQGTRLWVLWPDARHS